MKFTCQAEVSELLQQLFEYKQETLVTKEMQKVIKLKRQTIRRQSWRLRLRLNICWLYADMTKFGDYSIEIAKIDYKIKEKLNFRICPNSTINLLVSRSDMLNMHCFRVSWHSWRNHTFTHSLIVNNLLSSFLFSPSLKTLNLPLLSTFEIIRCQILTYPQNRLYRNYFQWNFDSAAKRSSSKIF